MMNDRIKKRRKELGITQPEVAQMLGISKTAISLWESGINRPNGENLHLLAKVLQCSSEYLLHGEEQEQKNASLSHSLDQHRKKSLGSFDLWDSNTPLGDDEVELPFFKEVELSAGNGFEVHRQVSGFKLRFAKSTLKNNNIQPELAACVSVSGDSMEPVLPDKATVGIDTGNTKIKDGDMYAIDHDGLLRVKMLHRLPGGGIRIRSFNRDDYPDEDYTAEQAAHIKILGRVFWYSVLR